MTEEHISLVEEPGSKYIGHVSPKSGSAVSVMLSIMDFMADNVVDNIVAVGCDSTVINTGQKGGVIRLMEQKLAKPL